ncbi:hypothetical protein WN944_004799 [Citrus x changshan-huyou]|uniref:Uncharacterized protein n=1 Tax=Citrus x changshan-huyou TaxID=2935761 RepID=A0AAP0QGN1_9ROSI
MPLYSKILTVAANCCRLWFSGAGCVQYDLRLYVKELVEQNFKRHRDSKQEEHLGVGNGAIYFWFCWTILI